MVLCTLGLMAVTVMNRVFPYAWDKWGKKKCKEPVSTELKHLICGSYGNFLFFKSISNKMSEIVT